MPLTCMLTHRKSALVLLLAAFSTACLAPKSEPPDKPMLDWESRTASTNTVILSGYAEPGAGVEIDREPEFPEDFDARTTSASTEDGRFEIELPLERNRANRFLVRARDYDDRLSEPAVAVVTHTRLLVTAIELDLESSTARIGDDGKVSIEASARVTANDPETGLDRYSVQFRVLAGGMVAGEAVAETDEEGVATTTVEASAGVGTVLVQATLAEGSPGGIPGGDTDISDSAWVRVLAGAPHTAQLELAESDGNFSASPRTVGAGTELRARVRVLDSAGNRVSAPWSLAVEPASAGVVIGDRIVPTQTGKLRVRALVTGENDSLVPKAPAPIEIDVVPTGFDGKGDSSLLTLNVELDTESRAGQSLEFLATLVDPYGNAFEPSELRLTTTDPNALVDLDGRNLVLHQAGENVVTFEADRGDGEWLSVEITVEVEAGPASRIRVTLNGVESTDDEPVVVAAGSDVHVKLEVLDAYGNRLPGDDVWLDVPADWLVYGSTVTAPTTDGVWPVTGRLGEDDIAGSGWLRVEPLPPDTVFVSCPESVDVGEEFECQVELRDRFGGNVDAPVSWELSPAVEGEIVDGRLSTTDAGTLLVTAVAGTAEGSATVEVLPGEPASVEVTLNPPTVVAGGTSRVNPIVRDAYGNARQSPVDIQVNAPGAWLTAGKLNGLTVAGAWEVVATVPDTTFEAQAELVIEPGPAVAIAFTPESPVVEVFKPLVIDLGYRDVYGNTVPGTPELLVDGAPADPEVVEVGVDSLTFREFRLFELTAISAGLDDVKRLILVLETPDTEPPNVMANVAVAGNPDPSDPLDPYDGIHRPGSFPELAVVANDNAGIVSASVLLSEGIANVSEPISFNPPTPMVEWSTVVPIPLLSDRVGTVDWTVTVKDQADSEAVVNGSFLVDAHHGRWTPEGVLAGRTVRSVSIDSALAAPTWTAVAEVDGSEGVFVADAEVAGGDGRLTLVGTHGIVSTAFEFPPGSPRGLGVLNFDGSTFYTGGVSVEGDATVLRFSLGDEFAEELISTGFGPLNAQPTQVADVKERTSLSRLLVAEEPVGPEIAGRLWSLPLDTEILELGGTIDLPEVEVDEDDEEDEGKVRMVEMENHRPSFLCAGGKNDRPLYFAGYRYAPGVDELYSGVYRIYMPEGGFNGGVLTVYEEPTEPGSGETIRYTGCSIVSGHVWAGRHVEGGGADGSSVLRFLESCGNGCTPESILAPTVAGMSSLGGLFVHETAEKSVLFVTEPDSGQVFEVTQTTE